MRPIFYFLEDAFGDILGKGKIRDGKNYHFITVIRQYNSYGRERLLTTKGAVTKGAVTKERLLKERLLRERLLRSEYDLTGKLHA